MCIRYVADNVNKQTCELPTYYPGDRVLRSKERIHTHYIRSHTHTQTRTTPVGLMCNRKPGVPMLLCMGPWKSSRVMKQKL